MMATAQPRLSLGPVSYYWSRQQLMAFYADIANTPVDIVYLGETVCSKRRALRLGDWLALAQQLESAGKEVVLSTLTLIEAESELAQLRRICANGHCRVEANDMAAVQLLRRKPFVTGPAINLYNQHSLACLIEMGLQRWVPPLELSRDALLQLMQHQPADIEVELFAYGRMPLAYSARCFTARAHALPKDDCQFRCGDDPDGLALASAEDEPFLVLNGIQTQSSCSVNLLPELDNIRDMGIDVLRISPQSRHTPQIIQLFHDALHHRVKPARAQAQLTSWAPAGLCDGFWYGEAGMRYRHAALGE